MLIYIYSSSIFVQRKDIHPSDFLCNKKVQKIGSNVPIKTKFSSRPYLSLSTKEEKKFSTHTYH